MDKRDSPEERYNWNWKKIMAIHLPYNHAGLTELWGMYVGWDVQKDMMLESSLGGSDSAAT